MNKVDVVTLQLEHDSRHGFPKVALKINQQVAIISSEQKKTNINSKCMQ